MDVFVVCLLRCAAAEVTAAALDRLAVERPVANSPRISVRYLALRL